MSIQPDVEQRLKALMAQLSRGEPNTVDHIEDLVRFGFYGQNYFSQFGLGLSGFVFRQRPNSVRTTVKVNESGVPLVAFITSATTMGSIEQMFDLLFAEKLKWQKDKFPWI